MKNIKAAIRRTLKDYHELQRTIKELKIQQKSPPVLSGKSWYQNEMQRLLIEEGIPEEEVCALAQELLNEEAELESKIALYERKILHKTRKENKNDRKDN